MKKWEIRAFTDPKKVCKWEKRKEHQDLENPPAGSGRANFKILKNAGNMPMDFCSRIKHARCRER